MDPIEVKCYHAQGDTLVVINSEYYCINCAVELSSKIANELLSSGRAALMYKLLPKPLIN
jgi:hypothetical protein